MRKSRKANEASAFITKFRRQFRKFGLAAVNAQRAGRGQEARRWAMEARRVHGNLARLKEAQGAAKAVHWARR